MTVDYFASATKIDMLCSTWLFFSPKYKELYLKLSF